MLGCVGTASEEPATEQAAVVFVPEGARVRVVAANLTSGRRRAYEAPGTRILQGLDADVVLLQEFNVGDNRTSTIEAWVRDTFGPDAEYRRESRRNIPNGVVSLFPIRAWGVWEDTLAPDREFVWARLDVPGDADLWVVSVHFLTRNSSTRRAEADALIRNIQREVPAGDYLIVGGDLNTRSRGESAVRALSAVVDTAGPYPTDQRGDGDTNRNRNEPYDWVLADRDLDALSIPTRLGSLRFDDGLVVDTRRFQPLSAIAPARSGDSNAESMQHMAVVRDFAIPVDGPPPETPTLVPGEAEVGLGAAQGEWLRFTVDAPEGSTLRITTTGGTGALDLYVRRGSEPTLSSFDCRPFVIGNEEECEFEGASGVYHIGLYAFRSFAGVSLRAEVVESNALRDGATRQLSASRGEWARFVVDAARSSVLEVTLDGGTGDADLYVRSFVEPTLREWQCRPWRIGNRETCALRVSAGRHHIGVQAFESFADVTLRVRLR